MDPFIRVRLEGSVLGVFRALQGSVLQTLSISTFRMSNHHSVLGTVGGDRGLVLTFRGGSFRPGGASVRVRLITPVSFIVGKLQTGLEIFQSVFLRGTHVNSVILT